MIWALRGEIPPLLDNRWPLPLAQAFTTHEAEAAGISRHVLARLAREGLVRRILKGVYVAAQVPDSLLLRAQALALVVRDGSAVTDWTACWVYTGVLPPNAHLLVPPVSIFRLPGRARLRNGLCTSGERTFRPDDLTMVEGVPVTTPLRTALDLGRLTHRDGAIAALDALIRHGTFSKEELLDNVERFRRQRGVVQLRGLAPLADSRAESPAESVLRLRWVDLPHLPRPEPQVPILSASGVQIYRIDLGVEELLFGVEYDGEEHHTSAEDREHDRRRREDLDRRFDWLVLPVTRANLFGTGRDIERILHEGVRAARLRRGRYRPSA